MARDEQPREDLLREATALVRRIELSIADFDEPIVVGFRSEGAASFYFGEDPAWHFNAPCEFRRGFVDGLLYKSSQGRLAKMARHRTAGEVQLIRTDLDDAEAGEFLARLESQLDILLQRLRSGDYKVIGVVMPSADETAQELIDQVVDWLERRPHPIRFAERPNVS